MCSLVVGKGITVSNEMCVYRLAESIGVTVDKISDLKPLYIKSN